MPAYVPTIGLEIHAELKTETKMFCGCKNDPDERHPNVNVCPVCLAHPGTLPVPNRAAIDAVLKVGMALQAEIPVVSKFDRKNYFYPDLPKGYQISQYDLPLVFGGTLAGVRITRVHLEEDTGRLQHAADGKHSLVDFNRAGVPLMELVTEPDIATAEQASTFARELQLILRYLGVSDADMEKGEMRVEANVSVRVAEAPGTKPQLGTKVEVKNLNSFKAVEGAIAYETKRQTELIESGGKVAQETRGWDDVEQRTFSQRAKESAHDYRYFPEPDIPPLDLSKFNLTALKREIPELPNEKRGRFSREYGLKAQDVDFLISDRSAAAFFEEALSELSGEEGKAPALSQVQLIVNYLRSDLVGLMAEIGLSWAELKIDPENFADLIILVDGGKITSRTAKDILRKMAVEGGDPNEIMREGGLEQVSDESALRETIRKILTEQAVAVADFKKGKENALQFLVGKAMAALKGKGNPQVLQRLFREEMR
jgi:aspartyl-tRNA(Asn)/glutamyl-tRNA(Gln) amidotransferase subunit B